MSWIKEANKMGEYKNTYYGFRIYCIKSPEVIETIVQKSDGLYNKTEFTRGEYVGIDKSDCKYEGDLERVIALIDKELIRRRLSKRYKDDLEWG